MMMMMMMMIDSQERERERERRQRKERSKGFYSDATRVLYTLVIQQRQWFSTQTDRTQNPVEGIERIE